MSIKELKRIVTDLFQSPISSSLFPPKFNSKDENGQNKEFVQKVPKLYYSKFEISNFKGVKNLSIRFAKDDLVLLLGLNESGKTTILKGIEAFDFRNDPDQETNPNYFTSIRRKSEVDFNGNAKITAEIILESDLPTQLIMNSQSENEDLIDFVESANQNKKVIISRIIEFENGEPTCYYYQFEGSHRYTKSESSNQLAAEIVKICPHVIYFEDFKDRIPEKIYVNKESDSYDPIWFDIIDGLFYNAKSSYTVEKFKSYYFDGSRDADAKTVLRQVNMELNRVFTKRWKSLSGVKQIADTALDYYPDKQYFQLKIYDTDGTNFSVDERSKGALWYLSFLMKTEFRSKKMRNNSGKPVYLIDEPASNLHSTAQMNMINNFFKLVKDTSIVYTTHSQYLISLKSIKNTYVIQRSSRGIVKAIKWSEYLKKESPDVKYYQPLANLLKIVPNNFDIPWKKAIITEGPSDMHVLKFMYEVVKFKKPDFTIYPGTSASKLNELISLNIGWNSDFKVLLDSDETGKEYAQKYIEAFDIEDRVFTLDGNNTKIEKCFSNEDKEKLYKIAFEEDKLGKITKKEFSAMFALLNDKGNCVERSRKLLDEETISFFNNLFNVLEM